MITLRFECIDSEEFVVVKSCIFSYMTLENLGLICKNHESYYFNQDLKRIEFYGFFDSISYFSFETGEWIPFNDDETYGNLLMCVSITEEDSSLNRDLCFAYG